jgi:hypothetical protein
MVNSDTLLVTTNCVSLIVTPTIKEDKVLDNVSAYQPTDKARARLAQLHEMMSLADNIRQDTYSEFNDNTLVGRANKDQEIFNGNTPEGSGDPNESWKANTVNPMARNRAISIMAHLIQAYLYPTVMAQNDQDQEDKEAGMIFSDLVEWALEQGHYSESMMDLLYSFVSEPLVAVRIDYIKATRKIKEIQDDGSWKWKEIEDDRFGGFQVEPLPYDEIYFTNVNEKKVQKQPLFVRKLIDYKLAEVKYGKLDNWKHVKPGIVVFYAQQTDTFYEKETDEVNGQRVEEMVYYDPFNDLEIPIVNGILMYDDPDRPLQREDKMTPIAVTGYEQIHNRFVYYKSLISKMAATQIDLNDLWNVVKDMARFQATPATYSFGFEEMDSSVMIPGMNTNTVSKEAGVVPINNGANLANAMQVIQMLQGAQNESSQAPLQSGQNDGVDKTKYEIQRLEMNAQTMLGLSGEMLAHLVKQIGRLTIGLVVQHLPMTEVDGILAGDQMLKMKSIIVPNRKVNGKKMSRKIEFTDQMPTSEEDEMSQSFKILADEEKMGMSIAKLNPEIMGKLKFLIKVEPTFTDRATEIAKRISLYDRLIANPLSNQEAALRDLLLASTVPGQEDKYIKNTKGELESLAAGEETSQPTQPIKQPAGQQMPVGMPNI